LRRKISRSNQNGSNRDLQADHASSVGTIGVTRRGLWAAVPAAAGNAIGLNR